MANLRQFVHQHATGDVVPVEDLCGWGSPGDETKTKELLRSAFDLWGDAPGDIYQPLRVKGAAPYKPGQRSMLWEVGRKVIGTDPVNYSQATGDCVGFSAKNAIEYVQFFPLAGGQRDTWTMVFPPFLWACGRLFVGKNALGRQAGSIGAWQAKAVMEYGTIPSKYDGVPEYSKEVAETWGNVPGPDRRWIDLGKQHIVRSAALVRTWEELVQALLNGYPVTVASNVGFDMTPRADGFHHYSAQWSHAMCVIGVDDDLGEPHACVLNTWGPNVHGQVVDFKTGEVWPGGTLRVRKADVITMLSEGDSFAYSAFDGFPAQALDREIFEVW